MSINRYLMEANVAGRQGRLAGLQVGMLSRRLKKERGQQAGAALGPTGTLPQAGRLFWGRTWGRQWPRRPWNVEPVKGVGSDTGSLTSKKAVSRTKLRSDSGCSAIGAPAGRSKVGPMGGMIWPNLLPGGKRDWPRAAIACPLLQSHQKFPRTTNYEPGSR